MATVLRIGGSTIGASGTDEAIGTEDALVDVVARFGPGKGLKSGKNAENGGFLSCRVSGIGEQRAVGVSLSV